MTNEMTIAGGIARELQWYVLRDSLTRSRGPRRATHSSFGRPTLVVVLIGATLSGCNDSSRVPSSDSISHDPSKVAQTEVERGPVRVSVIVEPHPARLSDEPTLRLTIDYQKGVEIDKPPFGEALGDFVILDYREPLPEMKDERGTIRQIYRLEPMRTGELQIAPIKITFVDNRPEGDGQQHVVETEALSIQIESVLESERPTLDDLRPAAGPVVLPATAARRWTWVAAMGLVIAAVGVVLWRRLRGGSEAKQIQLSPQEQAYLELEELLKLGLAESDIKLFYVQLTGIVRRYIERSTGIHAPEQTTEEFLHEISAGEKFAKDERGRLKEFLEAADLVKYAAHQPVKDHVEETFERAKVFIGLESQGVAA